MATLPNNERAALWAEMMRLWSDNREQIALTKTELRAAVDAMDDWINTNAASFNSAIPLPARTTLTTAQKSRLFSLVLRYRFQANV